MNYYGKEFIRKSLKTRDRNSAIRISSQLVTALEREWLEKRFSLSESKSIHPKAIEKSFNSIADFEDNGIVEKVVGLVELLKNLEQRK